MRIARLTIIAVFLSVLFAPLPASAQTELVANGGFESFDGTGLAASWSRWWEEIPNPGDGSLNYAYKPDWSPESNPALVHSGGQSQHIGAAWNPWHAGVFQTITARPGARVRITAYGRAFASTPDFPNPSDGAVQARMQIGADPEGGTQWWSGAVQWSGMGNPHDTWQPFTVEVTAGASGRVTIFLSANYKGDSRYHLDVWWDSVSAQVLDAAPTPTATPVPATAAPTQPSVQPTTQPSPTVPVAAATGSQPAPPTVGADLSVSPTPAATGTLCVALFEDVNGNGQIENGESPLTGGRFTVTDSNGSTLTYITDGANKGHCFYNLPASIYNISVSLPAGYNPTTGNLMGVNLQPGDHAEVRFGAQSTRVSQPAPTAAPANASGSSSTLIIVLAVVGVVLLAVVAAVGIVVSRTRGL
jgi:hypothetical protein